jgi:hypothetical protein
MLLVRICPFAEKFKLSDLSDDLAKKLIIGFRKIVIGTRFIYPKFMDIMKKVIGKY